MAHRFDPYDHFAFLTNRVARLLSAYIKPDVIGQGCYIPTSCIGVLADLWSADGVSQKDLGVSLIKTKSSINKMLQSLEDGGFIYKQDDPSDKRSKLIYLTDKGRAMQYTIERAGKGTEQSLLKDISAQDIDTTKRVLAVLYQRLATETNRNTPT